MLRATSWANSRRSSRRSGRANAWDPRHPLPARCSVQDASGEKRAAKGHRGAVVLGLAAQSEHERVAVHDARRRRLQCRAQASCGSIARASAAESIFRSVNAILGGLRAELSRAGICAASVATMNLRNAGAERRAAREKGKELAARNAQLRLERAAWIVDSRVDDLAVARAGAGANCAFRFEDDHFATGKREGSGACQADHACAYDDRIDPFHGGPSLLGRSARICLQLKIRECLWHCIVPIIYRLSTCSMGGHRICAGMAIKTNTLDRAFAPAGANDITARLVVNG